MKRCPRCGQTYTDPDINFCLNDGELLSRQTSESNPPYAPGSYGTVDDSPPTAVLPDIRSTNPTNWTPPAGPPAQYQQPYQSPIFNSYAAPAGPNQVLGVVSLATGAASLTIGWCCSLGLLFGPAAIITGFIALSQHKKDPANYGGRGFAIAGISLGGVFLLLWILYMILVVLLQIIPNLG